MIQIENISYKFMNQPQHKQSNAKEQVGPRSKLNPELVKKYEQIFKSFERQEDSGYVQTKDVPAIMKILGVIATEQQIIDMLGERVNKDQNPLVSAKIDFTDFLTLFVQKESEITMKEELMEAFKVFDTQGLGYVPVAEMRYYLRTYGITIPEEQVQQLLKESQPEDGLVKYEKFINKLLGLDQQ